MSDIIERMARALIDVMTSDYDGRPDITAVFAKTNHDPDCDHGDYCDFCWAKDMRKYSRAALAAALDAMQKPSEGMCGAGYEAADECLKSGWKSIEDHVWQAMLAQFRKEVLGDV